MQPSQYKRSEARELCKTDPIFLGRALGYDILENPHREMFDAMASPKLKKLVLWPAVTSRHRVLSCRQYRIF
jgi:hypothetical protein